MINILPLSDDKKLAKLFNDLGYTYNYKSGCVIADDNNNILGRCLYYIDEQAITILHIEPADDIFLADGILRSALHVADFRGISEAFYLDSVPEELLIRLDFIKSEADKSLKIEKLHQSSCNCEK